MHALTELLDGQPRLWVHVIGESTHHLLRLRKPKSQCITRKNHRAMHSADYAYMSVSPSHASRKKRLYIGLYHQTFSPSGSHNILVFLYIPNGITGASNARGYEKWRFSTDISIYIGNDTRGSHERRIGNLYPRFRMVAVSVTLSDP